MRALPRWMPIGIRSAMTYRLGEEGTSWTFIIFAVILLAISLTYFIVEKTKPVKVSVMAALVLVFSIFGSMNSFAFWQESGSDLYEDESIYNYLQMSSVEFFTEVKEHLVEDGVMIVNLNMRSDAEGSINDYLCDTVAAVFDTVYTADCGGNREVFASNDDGIAGRFRKSYPEGSSALVSMMEKVDRKLTYYEGGELILTDDKAPVELLGMSVKTVEGDERNLKVTTPIDLKFAEMLMEENA